MRLFSKKPLPQDRDAAHTAAQSKKTKETANCSPFSRQPLFETLEDRQLYSVASATLASALAVVAQAQAAVSATTAINLEYATTAKETDAYGSNVQGLLGSATSGVVSVPGVSGAMMQSFHDNGAIYWSPQTGAHVVYGGIGFEYNVTLTHETDAYGHNAQTVLGLPTSDETNISGVAGARQNTFQNGVIDWSSNTGAHAVYGGIGSFYRANGGAAGPLGLPTYDEGGNLFDNTFRTQYFQKGEIIWTPLSGAIDGFWGTLLTAGGSDASHPPFPIEKTITGQ